MVLKGITAKGKKEHGLVQGTAQHVLLDIARVWGVVGDEAKGNIVAAAIGSWIPR